MFTNLAGESAQGDTVLTEQLFILLTQPQAPNLLSQDNFAGQPAPCLLLRILTKPNPQEDTEIITIFRLRKAACRLIGLKFLSCLQPYFSDAKTLQ